MRWSDQKRNRPTKLRSHGADLLRAVARAPEALHVGLVGACDPASAAVRRAQSVLRFDRRPSHFSHAFLFTGEEDRILECRLVEADPSRPEFNGVCLSRAARYADPAHHPNLALISFRFLVEPERRQAVLDRARTPDAARDRYDFHALAGAWQAFLFDPEGEPNPLTRDVPHPGAAYLRWALEAAGLESAPGAVHQNDAPEHLWAAALRWSKAYARSDLRVRVEVASSIRDPRCTTSDPGRGIPERP